MLELNIGTLISGVVIILLGTAFIYFHKPIADNLGGGLGSYQKYKLYGVIAVVFGFLILFNIPQFLLNQILSVFFSR